MKVSYKCESCGRIIDVTDGKIPVCCNKPMKKQPLIDNPKVNRGGKGKCQ